MSPLGDLPTVIHTLAGRHSQGCRVARSMPNHQESQGSGIRIPQAGPGLLRAASV